MIVLAVHVRFKVRLSSSLIQLRELDRYFYLAKGYKQPISLLSKFKKIKALSSSMWVPYYSKKCLEFIYGKDWSKPDKQYDHRTKISWIDV